MYVIVFVVCVYGEKMMVHIMLIIQGIKLHSIVIPKWSFH